MHKPELQEIRRIFITTIIIKTPNYTLIKMNLMDLMWNKASQTQKNMNYIVGFIKSSKAEKIKVLC